MEFNIKDHAGPLTKLMQARTATTEGGK